MFMYAMAFPNETELLETTHAPANPEAMRQAAALFASLRTRAAFIGGALFAQLDLDESTEVES